MYATKKILRPLLAGTATLSLAISLSACGDATAETAGSNDSNATSSVTASSGKTYASEDFATLVQDTDTVVIDVRTAEEFAAGHLPGAQMIDIYQDDFSDKVATLAKDKKYAIYCRTGKRSQTALRIFQDTGLVAFDLQGGITAWSGDIEK